MKKSILILLIFNVISSFTYPVSAQGFLSTQGKAIVNESGDPVILRGMGLGGWMLQEGYMLQTSGFANAQYQIREKIEDLIGTEDTDLFYESWLSNHVRKIDIDSLKSWGFNSVRLPMHYNLFTLPIEKEAEAGQNTWIEKGFTLTDSLISWCAQNQMYVILDLHAAPGGQGYDQGISDYNPTKPSLWESQENRDKTVALWKKLAERYADEPWVGGYDLINETNWDMSGNTALRDLLRQISDSIRSVDTKHIIFIEGNWFANDFNGLTPPWDENMVYSPHKYWSVNDQNSIQWALDIRDKHNVPIFFGESGENSNVWFRDAIRLLEDHEIGWAWWPMKKIESIAGPLSQPKSEGYQDLLDYWNGDAPRPSAAMARTTLMQMSEGMRLENCEFQKDVIDAMFRQVYSNETIPYQVQDIPGIVYSTDFDMGVIGSAYYDTDVANYQVSTGNYTSWNNGWSYRNDAVDIEASNDPVNSNGYSVGWISTGEWIKYSVNVASAAIYDVEVRVASTKTTGKFHFQSGTADISLVTGVPNTGDWQNWQTITFSNVILTPSDSNIRFFVDSEEFNLGSFKFIQKGAINTIETDFLSAITLDDHTIQLNINKPLELPLPSSPAGFQISVNGSPVSITSLLGNEENPRMVTFSTNNKFKSMDRISISYSGDQVQAIDGSTLKKFSLKPVKNEVAIIHELPGMVEAEDYFNQSGIQLENTTDTGGGQNIGYLDKGDYADYYIQVDQAARYRVDYRTAALSETGAVKMELMQADGSASFLHDVSFNSTGDWQKWATTSKTLVLPAGLHHLRMTINQPLFNMNWFKFIFEEAVSVNQTASSPDFNIYPNPSDGQVMLNVNLPEVQNLVLKVTNLAGQTVMRKEYHLVDSISENLDLGNLPGAMYLIQIQMENGHIYTEKLILMEN